MNRVPSEPERTSHWSHLGDSIGPCRLVRELGAGGMGRVFLAELVADRPYAQAGTRVALKVLRPELLFEEATIRRFEREAALGAQVSHSCVVRTFESGQAESPAGPCHFLILEFVEGRTLRALMTDVGVLPEPLLRDLALRIAQGLQAVHDAGATHRDLKPENVLITPDHQVKVMDLGIAQVASAATRLTRTGYIVGSLLYSSPEQVAGDEVGPASDLYSLGVLLYEAATGVAPFTADTPVAVMFRHLEHVPERPVQLNPSLTPFFDALIVRLLEKRPEDRFTSAAEVAAILEFQEHSDWWRRASAEAAGPPAAIRLTAAREAPFVGREQQMGALLNGWKRLKRGEGRVVLLEGEAGVGKTRLLDEFVTRLRAEESATEVLYGSHPPGGLGGAADAISQAVVQRLGAAALERQLERWLPGAGPLLPAFAAYLTGRAPPAGAERLSAEAVVGLLCDLAESLARRSSMIWIVDDAHFSTVDSRRLMVGLARQLVRIGAMFVVTSRLDAPPDLTTSLLHFPGATRIKLGRLGTDEIIALVHAKVGRWSVASELGTHLAARTGGNPFFVLESIRDLEERGVLGQLATQPTDTHRSLTHLAIPATVRELLVNRLNELKDDERAMLDAAAVLGFEFDADLVALMLDAKRLDVLQRLAVAERRTGLVRAVGRQFQFDHHQLQELLYETLPQGLREEYHALAAERYAQRARIDHPAGTPVPAQAAVFLANHYFQGNRPQAALELALPALEHLRAEYRREALVQLAEVMLARLGTEQAALRADIELIRTDALALLGRGDEARQAAHDAAEIARGLGDQARLAKAGLRVSRQQMMEAKYDEAYQSLLVALTRAEEAGDRGTAIAALAALGQLVGLMGRFEEARQRFERQLALARESGQERLICEALGLLSNLYLALNQRAPAQTGAAEQLEVARRIGYRESAAIALFNLGQVAVWNGEYGAARRHLEEQLALSREILYRVGETLAHMALSEVHFETGGLAESRRHADLGADLAELWAVKPAMGYLHLRQGNVDWAEAEWDRAAARYQEALDHFRAARAGQGQAEAAFDLGRLRALEGRREEALSLLREAADLVKRYHPSVPGPLPAAYLALLGAGDPPAADLAAECRCSVAAELLVILHRLQREPAHLAQARGLLERMSAELDREAADVFWQRYPVARMATGDLMPGVV